MVIKSFVTWRSCLVLFLLSAPLAFVAGQGKIEKGSGKTAEEKSPAMKIRAVLEQPLSEDLSAKDLKDLTSQLSDRTGVKFFLDAKGIGFGSFVYSDRPITYDLKKGVKLGEALRRCLTHPIHKLVYVVLEDSVAVTGEQAAVRLQLGQLVSVRFKNESLEKALGDLQQTTPFNLVVDSEVRKMGRWSSMPWVNLNLENTTLEAAVVMMAEQAGLTAVSVDNAMFITTSERADALEKRKSAVSRNASPPPETSPIFAMPPGTGPGGLLPYGPPPQLPFAAPGVGGPMGTGSVPRLPPPFGPAGLDGSTAPGEMPPGYNLNVGVGFNVNYLDGKFKFAAGANFKWTNRDSIAVVPAQTPGPVLPAQYRAVMPEPKR